MSTDYEENNTRTTDLPDWAGVCSACKTPCHAIEEPTATDPRNPRKRSQCCQAPIYTDPS